MIFSTFHFTLIFLPLTFFLYSTLLNNGKIKTAKWVLVTASLIFYAYGSGSFFPFFVCSIAFNYFIGKRLGDFFQSGRLKFRRLTLLIGITGNIILLGYYKYTDFIIFNINIFKVEKIPYQHILLPIGISFFTFQLIAYLVDSYQGKTSGYSLLNYLLFITFFPQLIVGPIVHHSDVVPQYNNLKTSPPPYDSISKGLFLFSIGCSKKLIFADQFSEWGQRAFNNVFSLNMVEAWVASLSWTLAYYFDLSGYADMAIGLGLMFGIKLPINFNSPFKARNFAEYWRRWHITLSKFLGDYVFRNIYQKDKGSFNFYSAIFITFLVSGFWHGAGWTFVAWGIINGLFVIMSHMMYRAKKKLPFLVAWLLTFMGIVAARILFVSNTFSEALYIYLTLFNFNSFQFAYTRFIEIEAPFYLIVGLFIVFCCPNSNQLMKDFVPNYRYAIITSCLIVLSFLNMSNVLGFLYFQF